MTLDLSALNDEQRVAVTYGEGPLLVISAAGSGKTRVLTYRAAHLIESGIDASSIMLGTFTKKAATEMTERVAMLVGDEAAAMHSGTLHSLFLRVLRAESYPWDSFEILAEYPQKRLIRDILGKGSSADLASILGQISLWKNDLVDPRAAYEEEPYTARIFAEYEDEKHRRRVLDFDDMLTRAVELFEHDPAVLERYRARTPWLLIDEAQDTSTVQWRLLEQLSDGCLDCAYNPGLCDEHEAFVGPGNLTVVADWRQAIYSWRGARPEMILDFETRFPGAAVVGLPRNYRSTANIVEAANVLIRHAAWANGRGEGGTESRVLPPVGVESAAAGAAPLPTIDDMVADRPHGVEPFVTIAEDPDLEASNVVGEIQSRLAEGASPEDFAVLYRVNSYSRAFEQAFVQARIPYVVVGSLGFFGRKEVADVIAYLTFVHDPDNEEALRRIVNKPTRFLGRAYCDAVVAHARANGTSLRDALVPSRLKPYQRENAQNFRADVAEIENEAVGANLRSAIQFIRRNVGYDRWLLREEGSGDADDNRLENLAELENIVDRYGSLAQFLAFVEMQRAKSKSKDTSDRVQLMTIHRSKGLEWPTVFAVGFADGIIPHRRSTSPAELEEERRLAYVAVTRARDELFVSTPLDWQGRRLTPSRFVYEAALIENEAAEAMA